MANLVSQQVVEVVGASSAGKARVSQEVLEVVGASNVGKARVSQFVVEVLRMNSSGSSGGDPPGYVSDLIDDWA